MKRTPAFTVLAVLAGLCFLFSASTNSLAARIQGQVFNGTTQGPVASQKVLVISPRGGMAVVSEGTTGINGHFDINNQIGTKGFYLIQTTYDGVDYNAPIQFDPTGNAAVNLTVYQSTGKKPDLRINSARVIVRAEASQAHIQELYAIQNPTQKAYANPSGTFFFHIASGVDNPTVAAVGLMNMPLPQNPEKGKMPGDFYITYALKPGTNVLMVSYDSDYSGQQLDLNDSVAYPIAQMQLFVVPPTLTVKSSLFTAAGRDSDTGAQIYEASELKAGAGFAAQLAGEPGTSGEEANAGQQQEETQVKTVPDSITSVGIPFLLCFLLVLLWALGIRTAKEWPRWKARQQGSPVQKQFRAKLDTLINSIADIDELFASGKISETQYWKERLELKARAVAVLKAGPSTKSKPYASRGSSH
ncbi:MAG: hypothetical protein EPN47_17200 [Acidobacteria bacterium]|nr:MAG: hypothetical protein EPN47_17200 [Acidobacteriota bacterium]